MFDFKTTIFTNSSKEKILLLQLHDSNTDAQCYIFSLIQAMEQEKKYSSSAKVSEWNWEKNNGQFALSSTVGLRDYTGNDQFELILVDMNVQYAEGSNIPVIHPWHPRTFCNVYASDMSRDILFPNTFTTGDNYAPWGSHQSAAKLHDLLTSNSNKQFKSVTFEDAWKYTNSGYVVYLTAYHWKYYKNQAKAYDNSGHIATCYYTDNFQDYLEALVIQTGGSHGVMPLKSAWGSNYGVRKEIKANLYLGYILK